MNDTTVRELTKPYKRLAISSLLKIAILEQDQFWVPREAWEAYARNSLKGYEYREVLPDGSAGRLAIAGMAVIPDFTVPGVVAVEDMNEHWRANVIAMLGKSARPICLGMSFGSFLHDYTPGNEPGEMASDRTQSEEDRWAALADDPSALAQWLVDFPLMKALAGSL